MIFVILFILISIASLILAVRSMKSFEQYPESEQNYTLYLVKNPQMFNLATLQALYTFALQNKAIFSLERLFKGKESVLVLYAPQLVRQVLPGLDLLELEDYLAEVKSGKKDKKDKEEEIVPDVVSAVQKNTISVNQAVTWILFPGKNFKIDLSFFSQLALKDDQYFFWQINCYPTDETKLQVTLRAMVADPNANARIELAKRLINSITSTTGLDKRSDNLTAATLFEAYFKRSLIPMEVNEFNLSLEQVYRLLV